MWCLNFCFRDWHGRMTSIFPEFWHFLPRPVRVFAFFVFLWCCLPFQVFPCFPPFPHPKVIPIWALSARLRFFQSVLWNSPGGSFQSCRLSSTTLMIKNSLLFSFDGINRNRFHTFFQFHTDQFMFHIAVSHLLVYSCEPRCFFFRSYCQFVPKNNLTRNLVSFFPSGFLKGIYKSGIATFIISSYSCEPSCDPAIEASFSFRFLKRNNCLVGFISAKSPWSGIAAFPVSSPFQAWLRSYLPP